MRLPESVTRLLFEVEVGGGGFSMRVAGEADLRGPGDPDFDRPKGPFSELCRSLEFEEPRKPAELP